MIDDKKDSDDDDAESLETGCTLFVKNLNFSTTEDSLKKVSCCFLLFFSVIILSFRYIHSNSVVAVIYSHLHQSGFLSIFCVIANSFGSISLSSHRWFLLLLQKERRLS